MPEERGWATSAVAGALCLPPWPSREIVGLAALCRVVIYWNLIHWDGPCRKPSFYDHLHGDTLRLVTDDPKRQDLHWFLDEARKRGFKYDPRKAKREKVLRAVGYAATGLVGVWMLIGFMFLSLTSCHPIKEWHREQKLLECLQQARRDYAVARCEANWGADD